MSRRIISLKQSNIFVSDFGIDLDYEKEFTDSDFTGKEHFLQFLINEGYVTVEDDTKAHMPKGIVIYEELSYPNNRFVLKDGNIYQSDVGEGNMTSNTWVLSEWSVKVEGN